jgi:hypothetical protein
MSDSTSHVKKSQPSVLTALDPKENGDKLQHSGAAVDETFSLESLRLTQDFATAANVEPVLKTVPVRKPSSEWWVRVHPDPAYEILTCVIELKEEENRGTYLVAPSLWSALADETAFSSRFLFLAINTQRIPFIWPVRPPNPDRKDDTWNRSALDAAHEARSKWVRVKANMTLRAYEFVVAREQMIEPRWPKKSFQEIIDIGFRDCLIRDLSHPVLRQLRGE